MMTRRTFGQILASAAAAIGLPAFAQIPIARSPSTVEELTAWVEKHFDCRPGDPRAWTMHIPDAPTLPAVDTVKAAERVHHFVIAMGAINGTEAQVVDHLYGHFLKLHAMATVERPRLYWRSPIALDTREHITYGPQAIPIEDVEDGLATVPRGWALDEFGYQGGSAWRPLVRRDPVLTIRTRIGIYGMDKPSLAQPEGQPIPFI